MTIKMKANIDDTDVLPCQLTFPPRNDLLPLSLSQLRAYVYHSLGPVYMCTLTGITSHYKGCPLGQCIVSIVPARVVEANKTTFGRNRFLFLFLILSLLCKGLQSGSCVQRVCMGACTNADHCQWRHLFIE